MSNEVITTMSASETATVTMRMTDAEARKLLWETYHTDAPGEWPDGEWPDEDVFEDFGPREEAEVAEAKRNFLRIISDGVRGLNPYPILDALFFPSTLIGPVTVQREYGTGMVQVTAKKPSEALIRIARWMINGEAA